MLGRHHDDRRALRLTTHDMHLANGEGRAGEALSLEHRSAEAWAAKNSSQSRTRCFAGAVPAANHAIPAPHESGFHGSDSFVIGGRTGLGTAR